MVLREGRGGVFRDYGACPKLGPRPRPVDPPRHMGSPKPGSRLQRPAAAVSGPQGRPGPGRLGKASWRPHTGPDSDAPPGACELCRQVSPFQWFIPETGQMTSKWRSQTRVPAARAKAIRALPLVQRLPRQRRAGRTWGAGRAGSTQRADAAGRRSPQRHLRGCQAALPGTWAAAALSPLPPHPSPSFGSSQGQGQQHWAENALAGSCGGPALSPGRPRPLPVDLLLPARTNPAGRPSSVWILQNSGCA